VNDLANASGSRTCVLCISASQIRNTSLCKHLTFLLFVRWQCITDLPALSWVARYNYPWTLFNNSSIFERKHLPKFHLIHVTGKQHVMFSVLCAWEQNGLCRDHSPLSWLKLSNKKLMQTTEHNHILNFTGKGHLYIHTVVPGNRFYFTDPLNTVFFSILTLHVISLSLLLSFSCRIRVLFLQVCNHQLDHTDQGGSRYKLKYSKEGVKQKCERVFQWRISNTSKNKTDQKVHTLMFETPWSRQKNTNGIWTYTVCTPIWGHIKHNTNFTSHTGTRSCKN
jgi:hypothetical protein